MRPAAGNGRPSASTASTRAPPPGASARASAGSRCQRRSWRAAGAEAHVHRVHHVDGGEHVGGAGHARAHVEHGAPHAPGDLGAHDGLAQALARAIHGRARVGQRGARLLHRRLGVVHVLPGHGVVGEQRAQPAGAGLRVRQQRLSLGGARDRAAVVRVVGRRLDAVQHLAGAHLGALGERARGDDAGHLRAHLHAARRAHLPLELEGLLRGLRRDRHHAHLGRGRGRRGRLGPRAAGERERGADRDAERGPGRAGRRED
jgi:hypothetical protein